jgi:hypothetical protein
VHDPNSFEPAVLTDLTRVVIEETGESRLYLINLDQMVLRRLAAAADLEALGRVSCDAAAILQPVAAPLDRPPEEPVEFASAVDAPLDATAEALTVKDYLKRILLRLVRMNKIGAAHTQLENFFRGVPRLIRGDLKRAFNVLVHQGFIRMKPTTKGPHISLQPPRLREILQFLEDDRIPRGPLEELLA